MGQFGVGQSVRRKEDDHLLRGRARFQDDVNLEGQAHAAILRSTHAHAEIRVLDTAKAVAAPGVLAVYTGADVAAAGLTPLPCVAFPRTGALKRRDGRDAFCPPHPIISATRVRHVGDPVAMVVAETRVEALAAAEQVEVAYTPLPAVTETAEAANPDAPRLWDEAPNNICFDWEKGDRAATEAAFAAAERIVSLDLVNNRAVACTIEPRGATGVYDAAEKRYTLYVNCQHIYHVRTMIAASLGIDEAALRVISPEMGGGFGMKYYAYPEHPLVLWAAKALGRPVKWYSGRTEAFLSDTQGRDHVSHAELALDATGRFLGLRVHTIANLGAYCSDHGPLSPSILYSEMLGGPYTTPAIFAEVQGVFTNTVWTDAYRGAGRPEATYLIERLIDKASRELDIGAGELRRRNFVPPERMPYAGPLGVTYDSGEFARNVGDCMRLAEWDDYAARRKASEARGRLRGIGMAAYIEKTGTHPVEMAEIRFDESGRVSVFMGTMSSGQGHYTTFAQLVEEKLGIPYDAIDVIQGDTDNLPEGGGTGGSRSSYVGGTAIHLAAEKIKAKAAALAAHLLEVAEADLSFEDGIFKVVGTDRSIGLLELAAAARDPLGLPEGMAPGLDERGRAEVTSFTYPNGCHICEVEIDPETGAIEVDRYLSVNDFGTVINPMVIAGQVHGGIAQGLSQALREHHVVDRATGQPLSASFMDYGLIRADELPAFVLERHEVPCRTNVLGVKGGGEAGTVGALPCFINAVVDALTPLGIEHIDMPATPERIWRAIRDAGGGKQPRVTFPYA